MKARRSDKERFVWYTLYVAYHDACALFAGEDCFASEEEVCGTGRDREESGGYLDLSRPEVDFNVHLRVGGIPVGYYGKECFHRRTPYAYSLTFGLDSRLCGTLRAEVRFSLRRRILATIVKDIAYVQPKRQSFVGCIRRRRPGGHRRP
jgi:hypothetical protein